MQINKKWIVRLGGAAAAIIGLAILVVELGGQPAGHGQAVAADPVNQQDTNDGESAIAVTTIQPKQDAHFAMTYTVEPADVEPYYETEIEAEAAGPVEYIKKATGSPVKRGEVLVKIAVPDREQELAWKQEIVAQKQKELAVAEAQIAIAQAAVKRAEKDILLREDESKTAALTKQLRHQELDRVQRMVAGDHPVFNAETMDEQIAQTGAADAGYESSKQAVEKAKADWEEMQAKLAAAKADVELKKTLVRVAERDRDVAQAMVDFATVRAPYDGEIKDRFVNPGSFVQNASNGKPATPLLTLQTTRIVTVTVRLPDRYAPYVTLNTEADIALTDLPGKVIHGRVTRRTPSLLNAQHDRTMEVKVDLFNGTAGEYQKWLTEEKAKTKPFDDLRDGPLPLPLYPNDASVGNPDLHRLIPGMLGKMTLVLKRFKNSYLIPSSALVQQGGTPYVYLVTDGVAHLQQVKVLVNDQTLASIALVENTSHGVVTKPLTGKEEIVYSGQAELNDGTPVKTHLEDWRR